MKVRCNVDAAGFGQKPNKGQIPAIKARLGWSVSEVTPEELAGCIQQGRSWTPAELKGTKKDDWVSQQIVAVDVDNEKHKTHEMIPDPMTPERAREVYAAAGLAPAFMYYSFSHKAEWPRFRIVFFLDRVITNREQAEELSRRAIAVLNKACPGCMDTGTFNGDRLFFGGLPGCVFFSSGAITPLADLEALPASGYDVGEPAETPGPAAGGEPLKVAEAQPHGRPLSLEKATAEVKVRWREILPRYTKEAKEAANKETSYVCPFCGHGKNGDGLTYNAKGKPGTYTLHCFGCGFTGSIIDLVMKLRGVGFVDALRMCCEDIGIALEAPKRQRDNGTFGFDDAIPAEGQRDDAGATESQQDVAEPARVEKPAEEAPTTPQSPTGPATAKQEANSKPDFAAYLDRCREALQGDGGAWARDWNETQRGISADVMQSCGAGFDAAGDPANAPGALTDEGKKYPAAYMVFPTSNGGYSARRMDGREECAKVKAGPGGFFPVDALRRDRPGGVIFVTEGPHDAMSVYEVGYCGLALCSVSNAAPLLDALEREPLADKPVFVISLDNDTAGKGGTEKLKAGLEKLGYPYLVANISGKYHDPNDALVNDRDTFGANVARAAHAPSKKPNNTSWYLDNLMAGDILAFGEPVPTGFKGLDKKLGGGLHPGVYILGAVPSLGKSTLLLQMADQIAAGGRDVLIFSLEMSRLELVSKSLARITAEQTSLATAPTSLDIRKNKITSDVQRAAETYKKRVGDRLSVFEGNLSCTLGFIRAQIEKYIKDNDVKPVCILDYLQVLQQEENGKKQIREFITDAASEIERISKSLSIPFIVVSSVNRSNYMLPFDYESLKESGGLEFTADCVMGLQLECIHEELFSKKEDVAKKRDRIKQAKGETPRRVELVVLKNRYGRPDFNHSFEYYSRNELFIERERQEDQQTGSRPTKKGVRK